MVTYSGSAFVDMSFNVSYSASGATVYRGNPRIKQRNRLSSTDITKVHNGSATIAVETTLDVSSILDEFGRTLNFGTVKGVCILNNSLTATLVVGGGATPLFGTDQYTIGPGVMLPIMTHFATASHTLLRLTPSASLNYQVIIVGT